MHKQTLHAKTVITVFTDITHILQLHRLVGRFYWHLHRVATKMGK